MKDEKEVIDAFYSDKAFVKIKNKLGIGKILFAFADIADAKNKSIDYFMDAVSCLILCKNILNYRLEKKLMESLQVQKANGDKYPKEVWDSPVLPANEEKTVFREFHIGPSTLKNYKLSFRAKQGNITLFIPIESYERLMEAAQKLFYVLEDYCKMTYTVENTTSDYDKRRQSGRENNYSRNSTPQNALEPHTEAKSGQAENIKPPSVSSVESPKTDCTTSDGVFQQASEMKAMTNPANLCMQVYTRDSEKKTVIFLGTETKKVEPSKWKSFLMRCNSKENRFRFSMEYIVKADKPDILYFKRFK